MFDFAVLMKMAVAFSFCITGTVLMLIAFKNRASGWTWKQASRISLSIIFASIGLYISVDVYSNKFGYNPLNVFEQNVSNMHEQNASNAVDDNDYSVYVSVNSDNIDYSSYEVVKIDDEAKEILLKPVK